MLFRSEAFKVFNFFWKEINMRKQYSFTKYLLWIAIMAPLIGVGCVSVSTTEYVDSRIDKSMRELEERMKQENTADADDIIAKMQGCESAVIKQVVTALTNALEAKKIAINAQKNAEGAKKSAEDANVKAVNALDGIAGALTTIDKFTGDVDEVKKIADNALEKTTEAEARIAEALKAATEATKVAVNALELSSGTIPTAENTVSYASEIP